MANRDDHRQFDEWLADNGELLGGLLTILFCICLVATIIQNIFF